MQSRLHRPFDQQLTLASYVEGMINTAYVEPAAGGDNLPAMPALRN